MDTKRHGGTRPGAGRKRRFQEPTTRLRVPLSSVPVIETMLAQGREPMPAQGDALEILRPAARLSRLARPLFSSRVPAGFPSPADDYIEGALDLNEYFVAHPAATFFVRVTGDSMTGAGIFPGDILIVDRSLEPQHGNIVIAVVHNELTVKRLYRKAGTVELHPENPRFPVLACTQEMELVIWGVVSGVTRKL